MYTNNNSIDINDEDEKLYFLEKNMTPENSLLYSVPQTKVYKNKNTQTKWSEVSHGKALQMDILLILVPKGGFLALLE